MSETGVRATVEEFYRVLGAGDPDAAEALSRRLFSDDAVLSRPPSLPGGGDQAGVDAIARFARAVARSRGGPMDPARIAVTDVVVSADGVRVAVELSVPLGEVTTTAVEMWRFDSGRATALRAYYWDTAGVLAALGGS